MVAQRCSIIIRCLNEERHLPRLLEGLKRQTLTPHEIIVVDSGSTDGTVEVARHTGCRLVSIAQEEFSFGRSLNLGAAAASGEIVVLVSAHTYPATDQWLQRLTAPLVQPEVALVYGCQRGDHRTTFSEQQIFRQWFPDESHEDQRHPFCNNANAAVRRSVWQEMRYNEELPGLEDIEWAKRALARGGQIVYCHDATVIHVHQESWAQVFRRYEREAMALRMLAPWERMRLGHSLSLLASAIASDVGAARRQGHWRELCGSILRFRTAQYLGAYRGSRWHGLLTSELRARLYYPNGYRLRPPRLVPAPPREVEHPAPLAVAVGPAHAE